MKEKYILYVRDKGSDRTMEFELDNKEILSSYAEALIQHGYAEVRAVIEKAPQGVQSCQGNIKNNIQDDCNTKNEIKKVRLASQEDLKALSRTLNNCIDYANDVVWTLGKINEGLVRNLEEEE